MKRGDHTIKVTVSKAYNMTEIGSCLFKYTDPVRNMCLQMLDSMDQMPLDGQGSHDLRDRSTKRPSSMSFTLFVRF